MSTHVFLQNILRVNSLYFKESQLHKLIHSNGTASYFNKRSNHSVLLYCHAVCVKFIINNAFGIGTEHNNIINNSSGIYPNMFHILY